MSNALDLPIGAVFQGYYYPPTFSPIRPMQPRLLASMQFTRGHAMVYAERAEYSLYQEWERIEILFTPHRHAADTPEAEPATEPWTDPAPYLNAKTGDRYSYEDAWPSMTNLALKRRTREQYDAEALRARAAEYRKAAGA